MRTHLQIIADAGGYQALATKLGQPAERVRFWRKREAIPRDQFAAVIAAGIATLEELDLDLAKAVAAQPPQADAA